MFKLLRLIRQLRMVDDMAFGKRAGIRFRFIGAPTYSKVGSEDEKEYYTVPIFYRHPRPYDPDRIAIHEVRHRVQHNNPDMRLLTPDDEDLPDDFKEFLRGNIRPEVQLTLRETDAQLFDELAYPTFMAGDTKSFLKLLFYGTNLQSPR